VTDLGHATPRHATSHPGQHPRAPRAAAGVSPGAVDAGGADAVESGWTQLGVAAYARAARVAVSDSARSLSPALYSGQWEEPVVLFLADDTYFI